MAYRNLASRTSGILSLSFLTLFLLNTTILGEKKKATRTSVICKFFQSKVQGYEGIVYVKRRGSINWGPVYVPTAADVVERSPHTVCSIDVITPD